MVYAFFAGLFVGLPVGCYLRERGYANKLNDAFRVFYPYTGAKHVDRFPDTNKEFYQNLKKGEVDREDFERYIYGGSKNEKARDERDILEEQARKKLNEL